MRSPLFEKLTVTGLQGPVLTPLGGTLELSCQLSPPQDAQHMEIRWFQNHYTQPVHLYRDGKDLHGETISKYVERTELLKDDIGKGKVTLRIFNVTADDDGPYRCYFKDSERSEEHITDVKVTATRSDIQILMHPPNTKGVMLECHSGGWFPQPHMEWRDSKGEVIPATSKSYSQDENKLFSMTMALFIEASSHRNVTCYLQNHLTHQEESINIVISDCKVNKMGMVATQDLVHVTDAQMSRRKYTQWKGSAHILEKHLTIIRNPGDPTEFAYWKSKELPCNDQAQLSVEEYSTASKFERSRDAINIWVQLLHGPVFQILYVISRLNTMVCGENRLLKDATLEEEVTLRIFNVNPDDDRHYHCIFKNGKFYDEHTTEVKVIDAQFDLDGMWLDDMTMILSMLMVLSSWMT
ncbi:hypothetical protein STEG23_001393 [Scotinomys teguina]